MGNICNKPQHSNVYVPSKQLQIIQPQQKVAENNGEHCVKIPIPSITCDFSGGFGCLVFSPETLEPFIDHPSMTLQGFTTGKQMIKKDFFKNFKENELCIKVFFRANDIDVQDELKSIGLLKKILKDKMTHYTTYANYEGETAFKMTYPKNVKVTVNNSKQSIELSEIQFILLYKCDGDLVKLFEQTNNDIDIIDVIYDIAPVLSAMHRADYAHMDIKLENIVRCKGMFKMIDFNLVKSTDPIESVAYTPFFLHPALLEDTEKVKEENILNEYFQRDKDTQEKIAVLSTYVEHTKQKNFNKIKYFKSDEYALAKILALLFNGHELVVKKLMSTKCIFKDDKWPLLLLQHDLDPSEYNARIIYSKSVLDKQVAAFNKLQDLGLLQYTTYKAYDGHIIYPVNVRDGTIYISLHEPCPSIHHLYYKGCKVSEYNTMEMVEQIYNNILRHLHKAGYAHRNISPRTIYYCEETQQYKLGGFHYLTTIGDSKPITHNLSYTHPKLCGKPVKPIYNREDEFTNKLLLNFNKLDVNEIAAKSDEYALAMVILEEKIQHNELPDYTQPMNNILTLLLRDKLISQPSTGGSASIKYKGRTYKVRTGNRGGRYIQTKDGKVYLRQKA